MGNEALFTLSYGLYIVTSASGGRGNGQIANTVFQVTSDPPRLAVALNKTNLTCEMVAASGIFGISVLEQETPLPFIGRFGFRTGRDLDKLDGVAHEPGELGCPLVTEHALAVLEARVVGQYDAGTHLVFFGELAGSRVLRSGEPLTYAYYHQFTKGKTPKSAPTYAPAGEEGKL